MEVSNFNNILYNPILSSFQHAVLDIFQVLNSTCGLKLLYWTIGLGSFIFLFLGGGRENMGWGKGQRRERENPKQALWLSMESEPYMGLNPTTLRLRSEPKSIAGCSANWVTQVPQSNFRFLEPQNSCPNVPKATSMACTYPISQVFFS